MSELERLLDVQVLDSAIDQIPHRSRPAPGTGPLPGRSRPSSPRPTPGPPTPRAASRRPNDASSELERLGTARATKKARLEQQLKTVSAPREAEALMGEIATVDRERSEADDEELELLDVVEAAGAERAAAEADVDRLRLDQAEAKAALDSAEAALDVERAELATRRAEAAATVGASILARYDRTRKGFGGVAISRLNAGRCGACHLDQSRAALDALRHAPDDAEIECEQCGRLLVR